MREQRNENQVPQTSAAEPPRGTPAKKQTVRKLF